MVVSAVEVTEQVKAREELDWEPKVSFRDGLESTIDWYLTTHNGSTPTDERILLERA